jgi:2-oxoglutarate dehydrogenase E1 component
MLDLLSGENATFLDEKYRAWLADPQSVEPGWRAMFEEMSAGEAPATAAQVAPPPPDARSLFRGPAHDNGVIHAQGAAAGIDEAYAMRVARRQSAVVQFINAWRVRGHFKADIDPLGRTAAREHPELTLGYYGLTPADLDAVVPTPPVHGLGETATLRQIVAHLESVYGGHIGVEYMNIDNLEQKLWVQRQLETLPQRRVLDADEERRVLRKLCDGENFERMLHQKFPGTKRFSLEGGETLVPLMDRMIAEASKRGVSELVVGMAHRGRLKRPPQRPGEHA